MKISFISDNIELSKCVSLLEKEKKISVDLEFDKNRYRYGFNLCLIQIATDNFCFIIDPLQKGIQLKSIFLVFENANIQKIVYSFGEDLRLLHSLGCFPKNLFDISNAAKLLNYPQCSLSFLANELLGIVLEKETQDSNWYKRPLTKIQLKYAANDVIHLVKLKALLIKQAKTKNIETWIDEENLFQESQSHINESANNIFKDKFKRGLTEYQWFLFKKFALFREDFAKKYNKPNYQILHNNELLEIVKAENPLIQWQETNRIYKKMKSTNVISHLSEEIDNWEIEAKQLNLSKTLLVKKKLQGENKIAFNQKKRAENHLKKTLFLPIKEVLAKDFGEEAVTFILGNRLIAELCAGDFSKMKKYKIILLKKYIKELDLSLDKKSIVYTLLN